MSSSFDRNLARSLSQSLERDDMRSQASRINSMLTTVSLFVQKLEEAKGHIASISSLDREIKAIQRNREKTEEDEQKLTELSEDLKVAKDLDRQYRKSKDEVKDLTRTAGELSSILKRL